MNFFLFEIIKYKYKVQIKKEDLKMAEREIMGVMLGPNLTKNGRRSLNAYKEIEDELRGETIIILYIKAQRLKWARHVMRRN